MALLCGRRTTADKQEKGRTLKVSTKLEAADTYVIPTKVPRTRKAFKEKYPQCRRDSGNDKTLPAGPGKRDLETELV